MLCFVLWPHTYAFANWWEHFTNDGVATSEERFMSGWIRTQFTVGNLAFSLLRQRSTLNIFQAILTYIGRGSHVYFCCAQFVYSFMCSTRIVCFQAVFECKHLLLLPFRFPFANLFLFSSFLYILSLLALTIVDPNLTEYISKHREMGEILTTKEYRFLGLIKRFARLQMPHRLQF